MSTRQACHAQLRSSLWQRQKACRPRPMTAISLEEEGGGNTYWCWEEHGPVAVAAAAAMGAASRQGRLPQPEQQRGLGRRGAVAAQAEHRGRDLPEIPGGQMYASWPAMPHAIERILGRQRPRRRGASRRASRLAKTGARLATRHRTPTAIRARRKQQGRPLLQRGANRQASHPTSPTSERVKGNKFDSDIGEIQVAHGR